jgi:hypothetical protein
MISNNITVSEVNNNKHPLEFILLPVFFTNLTFVVIILRFILFILISFKLFIRVR